MILILATLLLSRGRGGPQCRVSYAATMTALVASAVVLIPLETAAAQDGGPGLELGVAPLEVSGTVPDPKAAYSTPDIRVVLPEPAGVGHGRADA